MILKDDWFFQKDIEQQFVEFTNWKEDLVPVFEERHSYVEALQSFCFPIRTSRLKKMTFAEMSWHYDYTYARTKLFQHSSRHFLTRAFRNRAGNIELRRMGARWLYIDPSNKIMARKEVRQDYAYAHNCILIAPRLIAEFLVQTRQTLLWCVSSIRFSERRFDEFRTKPYEKTVPCTKGIYVRSANPITREGKDHLPRMNSASRIVGKRHVHEIDHFLP